MPLSRRAALAIGLLPSLAQAQDYPARPPRLLVGFPPGSAADLSARLIAPALGQALGQAIIVENRPGAGSNIAAAQAVRAPPDGYTLLLGTTANTINSSLQRDLTFDFARDLAPVAPIASVPNLLVVHPSVPANNVAEFIALARTEQLFFGSSGIGTGPHLSGELFNLMTGARMTHVPYLGSGQAVTDLLAGRVGVIFSPASTVIQHVRAGRLRGLASCGATRTAAAPELPTMIEAGLAGFQSSVWFGLMAPGATPTPIVARLAEAVRAALNTGDTRTQFTAQGFDVLEGGPTEMAQLIAEETTKWAQVVEASGVRSN
ncbi:MAG: tripartite tricarboxylate transporter substrate binding protein [Roseococcus sp.]